MLRFKINLIKKIWNITNLSRMLKFFLFFVLFLKFDIIEKIQHHNFSDDG